MEEHMIELLGAERREAETNAKAERPDPGGVVRRGGAAQDLAGYAEVMGTPPPCCVHPKGRERCEQPAAVEVYGLWMCEIHGEEAAGMALEEIAYDLEQEMGRFTNPYVRDLSPHLKHALFAGPPTLPAEVDDYYAHEAALLAAWPLERERAASEIFAYIKDPPRNEEGQLTHDPPSEAFQADRLTLHRHMRLAFEEDAHWLVETLEGQREYLAEQIAYALALETEAGLRGWPDKKGVA